MKTLIALLALVFCSTALAQDRPGAPNGPSDPQPATQPAQRQQEQPAQPAEPAPPPSADQMLQQLLRPSPTAPQPLQPLPDPPAVDRTTGAGAVAPGAQPMSLIREGTYIVDRIGRLNRTADGQLEFVFEADGRAMQDPPLLLLPNLKLMAMENAVRNSSRDLKFRITGMVTEYGARNYILLEKAVVIPDLVQP